MTAFYDEQMAEAVEQSLKYLMTERGQTELRKIAAKSKELADVFRKAKEIPWERLHEPFNV